MTTLLDTPNLSAPQMIKQSTTESAMSGFPNLGSRAPQLSVPDYMEPTISKVPLPLDAERVMAEVHRILLGSESDLQPCVSANRVVDYPPVLQPLPIRPLAGRSWQFLMSLR